MARRRSYFRNTTPDWFDTRICAEEKERGEWDALTSLPKPLQLPAFPCMVTHCGSWQPIVSSHCWQHSRQPAHRDALHSVAVSALILMPNHVSYCCCISTPGAFPEFCFVLTLLLSVIFHSCVPVFPSPHCNHEFSPQCSHIWVPPLLLLNCPHFQLGSIPISATYLPTFQQALLCSA